MMHDNYAGYLAFRAAQRRLAGKFSYPRRLLLHALIFVVVMTAIWLYGNVWNLWIYQINFPLPALVGLVWSVVLVIHAALNFRRSPARDELRAPAVEDEMRQFIGEHGDEMTQAALFDMHGQLDMELERRGRLSQAVLVFALVNVVSWAITVINMGTSWGFQMTLPLAGLLIGGVYTFQGWQRQQASPRKGWFARLPLRHIIAYGAGIIGLWLIGSLRLINTWDANMLTEIWTVALLLHIAAAVVVGPLLCALLPARTPDAMPAKRKPGARLALGNDGELHDFDEPDSAYPDKTSFSSFGAR